MLRPPLGELQREVLGRLAGCGPLGPLGSSGGRGGGPTGVCELPGRSERRACQFGTCDFPGRPSPLVSRIGFEQDGLANAPPTSWVAPASSPPATQRLWGGSRSRPRMWGRRPLYFHRPMGGADACSGWGGLTAPGRLRATHAGPKAKDEEHATMGGGERPRLWRCCLLSDWSAVGICVPHTPDFRRNSG